MKLELFQVDAFTRHRFGGNPAAVVPLTRWLPDATMQQIAGENNLSETAFFVPRDNGPEASFSLRWFTPTHEVDLCGHATLATAHVLASHLDVGNTTLRFVTQQGEALAVRVEDGRYTLDFPRCPASKHTEDEVTDALGQPPSELYAAARDLMAVFANEEDILALKPDLRRLAALSKAAIITTAPGAEEGVDFVSRFFAPALGIAEDPVTGSAHCTLTPYWAKRLDKRQLHARQLHRRRGTLLCTDRPQDNRVEISGHAVTYLRGAIEI